MSHTTFPYHHWVLPHSAVDTICICDHEPGKKNHVDLVVVSTNPIDKNMLVKMGIISPYFLGVKIQKKKKPLPSWVFFPFFLHWFNKVYLKLERLLLATVFLCLIVIDSWLLCTLFATLETYMKQWNFDPLKKNIKNEEVEEISFCHQVGAFNHTVPGVLQQTVIQQRTCLIYPSPSTSDNQDYYMFSRESRTKPS